jgi:thiamine biosynthesis lipoprotein
VAVSADTITLIEHAVVAWAATEGRYDPTVLPAVRAIGYERDLALVAGVPNRRPLDYLTAAGCDLIEVDQDRGQVRVPAGVEIDPGGIGKGLAADIVTGELEAAGAIGSIVNLGGDLRARGEPPEGDSWSIGVEHPLRPTELLLTVGLLDGAVATSSRLRRRWSWDDGTSCHHLVDPHTGRPLITSLVAVTAVAAEGWWAEAVAKATFVAGTPATQAFVDGALLATVEADGAVDLSPGLVRVVS